MAGGQGDSRETERDGERKPRGWRERRSARSRSEVGYTQPSGCITPHPQEGEQLSGAVELLVLKPRQCWARQDSWSLSPQKYSHTWAQGGALLGLESLNLFSQLRPLYLRTSSIGSGENLAPQNSSWRVERPQLKA